MCNCYPLSNYCNLFSTIIFWKISDIILLLFLIKILLFYTCIIAVLSVEMSISTEESEDLATLHPQTIASRFSTYKTYLALLIINNPPSFFYCHSTIVWRHILNVQITKFSRGVPHTNTANKTLNTSDVDKHINDIVQSYAKTVKTER